VLTIFAAAILSVSFRRSTMPSSPVQPATILRDMRLLIGISAGSTKGANLEIGVPGHAIYFLSWGYVGDWQVPVGEQNFKAALVLLFGRRIGRIEFFMSASSSGLEVVATVEFL